MKELIEHFSDYGYQVGPKTLHNKALEEMLKPVRAWLEGKQESAKDRYATGEAYIYQELIHDIDLATNKSKGMQAHE